MRKAIVRGGVPDDRKTDPEPLAIAGLCVATLTMAGAVANAYVNYRKLVRDEELREDTVTADFLAHCDALRGAGERLLSVIRLVSDHGDAAFRMTHRLPGSITPPEARPLTLRAGESSLELATNERQQWDRLVEDESGSGNVEGLSLQVALRVQPGTVPYHDANATEGGKLGGYAVVPTEDDDHTFRMASRTVHRVRGSLEELRLKAPDPGAQAKYTASLRWLEEIEARFATASKPRKRWIRNGSRSPRSAS